MGTDATYKLGDKEISTLTISGKEYASLRDLVNAYGASFSKKANSNVYEATVVRGGNFITITINGNELKIQSSLSLKSPVYINNNNSGPYRSEMRNIGGSNYLNIEYFQQLMCDFGYKLDLQFIKNNIYAFVGEKTNIQLEQYQKEANARFIYNYLSKRGWTLEAVSGLLGNIDEESRLNPGEWQYLNDVSFGYGIVQWDDGSDFLDWAGLSANSANNLAKSNPETLLVKELEFLVLTSKYSTATAAGVGSRWIATNNYGSPYKMTYDEYIVSKKSAHDLALVFHASYERSGDTAVQREERATAATKWYNYLTAYK